MFPPQGNRIQLVEWVRRSKGRFALRLILLRAGRVDVTRW
jgi:hypothetical protein